MHQEYSARKADTLSEADRIFVLVDGSADTLDAVELGKRLAEAMHAPWEAIYVETPSNAAVDALGTAGDALAHAARIGATVYRFPAATVADGIEQHVRASKAPHIVLTARPRGIWQRLRRRSLLEELARRDLRAIFHVVGAAAPEKRGRGPRETPALAGYSFAAAAVALTLAAALLLNVLTGAIYLSVLFLFPVIAVAARAGMRPALFAALLSAVGFNFLFLDPIFAFDPLAAQSWVMAAVLVGVAVYTALLTGTLRGRLALSDRSAQESAELAAFAQKLTRVSDWTSTGKAVCQEVRQLLGVRTLLFREVEGRLEMVGAAPEGAMLDPLDRTALDLAWTQGEATGSGTPLLSEASWQFHPLKTSLGMLAVLGVARDDGRNPVAADRAVLLATIVAQAALAHERLRLEDLMRSGSGHPNVDPH